MTAIRTTQVAVEILSDGNPNLRGTQAVVEIIGDSTPAIRVSQYVVEIANFTPAPSELWVTQLVRLSLTAFNADLRVTTLIRLALVELFADIRVTSLVRLTLAEAIPCLTYWATMWRIERTDGEVFAFTSHDVDLEFRGETYRTCASLQASATEQGAMLGDIGNMELLGLITDDSITEDDLFAGLFDGASLEVWLYPWSDAGGETPRRLIAGKTGTMSQKATAFTMEVLTASQEIQQRSVVELVTPDCRFELGDERCTVDLEALRTVGEVQGLASISAHSQSNKRIFFDPVFRTEATGHWNGGTITFTSGDNNGLSSEVKTFDHDTGELVLWEPLQYPLKIGDTYSIVPGCDKTSATCKAKFNNFINYGGFPNVPGGDAISQTPNAGGGGNVAQDIVGKFG